MPNDKVVEIGNATLIHADCRDVLKDIHADVMITDPVWPNCPDGLLEGSDNPYDLFKSAMTLMNPVSRAVVVMRNDSDPRFLSAINMPFFRLQILPYVMPGYIGRKLGGDEIAYCFGDPIPSSPGKKVIPGRAPSVQPDGRKANGHPCSRALNHFRWLVNWWSIEDEVVIDPFAGSGTTGVACIGLGREFIGIEVEKKYFDIMCERIQTEVNNPSLLTRTERKICQTSSLFGQENAKR